MDQPPVLESDMKQVEDSENLWGHVKAYSLMTFFTVVCVVIGYQLVIYVATT